MEHPRTQASPSLRRAITFSCADCICQCAPETPRIPAECVYFSDAHVFIGGTWVPPPQSPNPQWQWAGYRAAPPPWASVSVRDSLSAPLFTTFNAKYAFPRNPCFSKRKLRVERLGATIRVPLFSCCFLSFFLSPSGHVLLLRLALLTVLIVSGAESPWY